MNKYYVTLCGEKGLTVDFIEVAEQLLKSHWLSDVATSSSSDGSWMISGLIEANIIIEAASIFFYNMLEEFIQFNSLKITEVQVRLLKE